MSLRDSEPHARAHEGPYPLDLSSRGASCGEKASDCAARLRSWEDAEAMLEVRRLLAMSLRGLTERERTVLHCRYWLGLTLEETARLAECGTRERARQIEAKALRRLRHPKRREVRIAGDLLGLCTPAMLLGRHP